MAPLLPSGRSSTGSPLFIADEVAPFPSGDCDEGRRPTDEHLSEVSETLLANDRDIVQHYLCSHREQNPIPEKIGLRLKVGQRAAPVQGCGVHRVE